MDKLVGKIQAVEYDDMDEPVELCIETDEDRYLIANIEECEELLDCEGKQVLLECEIVDELSDEPSVEVHGFEVMHGGDAKPLESFDDEVEVEEEQEEEIFDEGW